MSAAAVAPPVAARGPWLPFLAGLFPASLFVATQTVANAVLPQMQGDLAAGIDQISWVVTAGVVAGAIGIPPTSWLTGRFGRRRLMMISMCCYTVGMLMVGIAESLAAVVFWRALAAFCTAPVVALSQTITLDSFPTHQHPSAFAFWSIGLLSGWVFAPALGAWIADHGSWRLIFFALTPAGVLGVLAASLVPETERDTQRDFDWFGFGTLSLGIGGALLALNRGERLDWFQSGEILACTALSLLGFYLFVAHTLTGERVFIRWRVFHDRNYAVGITVVLLYSMMSLAPLVLIPNMLRQLRDLELLTTGLALVPRGLAQIAGLLIIGKLVRVLDTRLVIIAGFLLFALSCHDMARFNADIGLDELLWPNLVQGFSMALIWAPAASMMYANVPGDLRTDATTVSSLLFTMSSSIGVSLSVTLLTRSAQISHQELATRLVADNPIWRVPGHAQTYGLDSLAGLGSAQAEVARQALMIGFANVFFAMALVALAVIPLVLLLRKP